MGLYRADCCRNSQCIDKSKSGMCDCMGQNKYGSRYCYDD